MTNFVASGFDYHNGYLYYLTHTENAAGGYKRKFVARFKYNKPLKNKNAFQKFLIAYFTEEEYFEALEAGTAPLVILESKGYQSPNMIAHIEALGLRRA